MDKAAAPNTCILDHFSLLSKSFEYSSFYKVIKSYELFKFRTSLCLV